MKKILILGYGNMDRQDDGAAWHVLSRVAEHLDGAPLLDPAEAAEPGLRNPDLIFALQLLPEMAETIAGYDRACFIDAHTGAIPAEWQMLPLTAEFRASPFTHHLTPQSCLEMAAVLYHHQPEAWLVSVRGYEFGFGRELSERTQALVETAAAEIARWVHENG